MWQNEYILEKVGPQWQQARRAEAQQKSLLSRWQHRRPRHNPRGR